MNVEIGAEAALFPEKEYINGIAVAVHLCSHLPEEISLFQWKVSRDILKIQKPPATLIYAYIYPYMSKYCIAMHLVTQSL
jgi:hypothetical protein